MTTTTFSTHGFTNDGSGAHGLGPGGNVGRHRRRGLRAFTRVRLVVTETEHAVLMTDGKLDRILETGIHKIRPRRDRVIRFAATEQLVVIPGQEVLTGDGAGIRATVAAAVKVVDPMLVARTGGWRDRFYLDAQLAMRNIVATLTLDELLAARGRIDSELDGALQPKAGALGIELLSVAIRDLIVPGELRRAVADVVAARLSGQASLERARGESAALRSLANAAKAATENPALLQLRMIQQIENSSGNTFVLGSTPLLGS